MEGQTEGKIADVAGDQLAVHVVQAVEGMYNLPNLVILSRIFNPSSHQDFSAPYL
jgi:hypothetical protein